MNDQVKRFFAEQKFLRMMSEIEAFREELQLPVIHLQEAVGEGLDLQVTQKDINFIHAVQLLAQKQGKAQNKVIPIPPPWRILSAKYYTLPELPLHKYSGEWDEKSNIYRIYEERKTGGHVQKKHHVADCNDEMKQLYQATTGREVSEIPNEKSDKEVADWWMEENKNCTHFDVNYSKKGTLPNPQVKIIHVGPHSVSLGFRAAGPGIKWNEIKNIPLNRERFKKQAAEAGYEEKHASSLLRYTGWRDILAPYKTGKGGKELNPEYADSRDFPAKDGFKRVKIASKGKSYGKDKGHRPVTIKPGWQDDEIITSEEFSKLYNQSHEFRNHIEKMLIKSVQNAFSIVSNNMVGVKIGFSPDTNHKISVTNKGANFGLSDTEVDNVIQDTRSRLVSHAGKVKDSEWQNWQNEEGLDDWIRKTLATGARNSVKKYIGDTAQRAAGSGDPGASAGGGERHGGHEDLAANQGGSGDVADVGSKKDFLANKVSDIETPEDLEDYIRENPSSMTSDKIVRDKILQFSRSHPKFMMLAKHLGLAQDDQGTVDKYSGPQHTHSHAPRPSLVNQEGTLLYTFGKFMKNKFNEVKKVELPNKPSPVLPYTFKHYMSEMGVVWGNDPASAKKLKPGQTLKGGIQVQGAPWTVGGSINKKDNDIKVN